MSANQRKLTPAVVTRDTSGAGTALYAAPESGSEWCLGGWQIQANADEDTTVILKGGSTVIYTLVVSSKSAGALQFVPPEYIIGFGDAQAVYADLSDANEIKLSLYMYKAAVRG